MAGPSIARLDGAMGVEEENMEQPVKAAISPPLHQA